VTTAAATILIVSRLLLRVPCDFDHEVLVKTKDVISDFLKVGASMVRTPAYGDLLEGEKDEDSAAMSATSTG